MRSIVAGAGVVLLMLGGGPTDAQQTGEVRGKIEIGIPVTRKRPASVYPSRTVPQPALAPASELRHVVVYLRDARPRAMEPQHASIRQKDENFVPRVVAVPIGSDVDFPNDDPIYHNVFSLSHAKTFNLGRYPEGKTKSVHFDKAGVVKVFCEIHSHMSATVMVFNHPWFTIPDEDGTYALPPMPPGEHQITAWHERLGDKTVTVRVEPGRPTDVDFVLPVPAQ